MITTYYQSLWEGLFNIPDKVVISLPANEIEYDKYRKSCIRGHKSRIQQAKLGDSPQCYKSDADFEHPSPPNEDEIPTVLFLKPLGTYNYQKIKKRSTASNNYLKRLNFTTRRICEVAEVELVNEGWEIVRVIPLDIYSSFFIPDPILDNLDSGAGILIQVNHPGLSREVEKLGYSSDNLCFIICVTPDFFLDYLSTYSDTNSLLFSNVRGNIRFTNISVNDYFDVDQCTLTLSCDFISEESYQRYKDSVYKLAVGLGNSNNFLKTTDKYIPGHLYKFLCTKKTINVGDRRSNSFFLLYVGKIGLSSYISSTSYDKHSTLFCNNFIDMFDAAEFNEWTDDRGKICRFEKGDLSNCRLWGELDIPVDVFIPINHSNRGRCACKGRLIKNILVQGKPYTEEEFYNHEGEVFKLAGKARELCFNNEKNMGEFDIHEIPTDYFPEGVVVNDLDEVDYLAGEELVPRFVILPSVDLMSSKKKDILEVYIEGKLNPDYKKPDSVNEAEYKTSYKHFMDILDAGEYVSFKSPTESIMKNLLLRAEGEITNYSYYALRQKYRGYYDTNPAGWRIVGIDSYDLFSEEELSKLDDRVLGNLKNNLSNLILTSLLIYGLKYLEYKLLGHSYLSSFSESSFMPEFGQVTGLLKEIEEEVFKCYSQSKSDKPSNTGGCSISLRNFTTPGSKYSLFGKELLESIIGVLMNGNSRERKYRKGGIDHIIKKYKLTTEDFKKCELYQK